MKNIINIEFSRTHIPFNSLNQILPDIDFCQQNPRGKAAWFTEFSQCLIFHNHQNHSATHKQMAVVYLINASEPD